MRAESLRQGSLSVSQPGFFSDQGVEGRRLMSTHEEEIKALNNVLEDRLATDASEP